MEYKKLTDDELVRKIPDDDTILYYPLPYIRILTSGKGNRETFKGYERGNFEIISIRGKYSIGYDSNSKEFSRLFNESVKQCPPE